MITAVVALVAMNPSLQAKNGPSALISKMLARYYGASTLTGKLSMTMSATDTKEKGETSGSTEIQYERPGKLFVRQSINSRVTKGVARIVSDGKRFLYSLPKDDNISSAERPVGWDSIRYATDIPANRELVEDVMQFNVEKGKTMPLALGEIYIIGRSGLFLKPEPLAVAIGYRGDLKRFSDQLVSVEDLGTQTINGRSAHLVGGSWREYAGAPVSGQYQIAITNDGDLVRYIKKETLAGVPGNPPIDITTTWNVDLQVGGKVNPKVFVDRALVPPAKPAEKTPK